MRPFGSALATLLVSCPWMKIWLTIGPILGFVSYRKPTPASAATIATLSPEGRRRADGQDWCGSIVNNSSIMGFVGSTSGHPAYHASKGVVRIYSKAAAVRYGSSGVRVNTVHPGYMPPMPERDQRRRARR